MAGKDMRNTMSREPPKLVPGFLNRDSTGESPFDSCVALQIWRQQGFERALINCNVWQLATGGSCL